MSDSRFPNLPPASSAPPPEGAAAKARFNAQVTNLPPDLQALSQATRLQGQVVALNNDGTVTIKTDQGQITAQITSAAKFIENQIVDLYLAKGNPPQEVLIRPSSQNQLPQNTQQAILQDIGSIPEITALTLENIAGTQATLTPLPQNQIASITAPFVETLDYTLNQLLQSQNPVLPSFGNIPEAIISTAPPDNIPPPALLNFFEGAFSFSAPKYSLSRHGLPDTSHLIPFRSIAAHILKSDTADFITAAAQDAALTQGYERLPESRITINGSEPAQSQTAPILHASAGEIIGFIEGLSSDRHLPVIGIVSHEGNTNYYVLDIDITDARAGSILKFIPQQGTTFETGSILPQNISITGATGFSPATWHSLEDLLGTLQQNTPQTAQAFVNMTLAPSAPQNMGSIAMFFIAALRSGDLQGWLGSNAVSALKKAGKQSLMNTIRQEGFSHSSIDSIGQEWRSSSLPLSWDSEIHKIVLHMREEHHENAKDQEKSKNHTRFVLDLNLSNIGPVQIDALHKKQSGSPDKLDLALRTQSAFSKAVQADMTARYKIALEKNSMSGDLTFQNTPECWVTILPDQYRDFAQDGYSSSV